jgi:hypothetical protein
MFVNASKTLQCFFSVVGSIYVRSSRLDCFSLKISTCNLIDFVLLASNFHACGWYVEALFIDLNFFAACITFDSCSD